MTLFKSFLKAIRFVVVVSTCIVLSGCITSFNTRNDLLPYVVASSFYSPNKKLFSNVTSNCHEPTCLDAKPIFDRYCRNGRQILSLTTNFTSILGDFPKNIALDEASKLRKSAIYSMEQSISEFYFWGLDKFPEEPWGYYDPTHGNFYLFGLNESNSHELVKKFKSTKMGTRITPRQFQSLPGPLGEYSRSHLITMEEDDTSMIFIGYFEPNAYKLSGFIFPSIRKVNFENYLHCDKNLCPYPIFGSVGGEKLRVYKGYVPTFRTIFPVKHLIPLETYVFSHYYTMLIPKNAQLSMFGKSFFIKNDGAFDISKSIEDRKEIWKAYIKAFVSFKQSQDKDPSTIKYQATLDLSAFCAYGRSIDNLITK